MTRFRNVKVGVFRQHESTKTILKNENMGQNRFKKLSKFRKFYFDLVKRGKMNRVRPDMTYSKELQQKMKMLDKLMLKTFELNNFSEILCHDYI